MLNSLNDNSSSVNGKQLSCGVCSPTPSIDLETKKLIHCGSYLKASTKVKYTPEIFERHLKCSLFIPNTEYCDECYIYANDRINFILSVNDNSAGIISVTSSETGAGSVAAGSAAKACCVCGAAG